MPEHTIQTKFFTENQNNSGGDFDHNPEAGIGYRLCVEARDAAEAEQLENFRKLEGFIFYDQDVLYCSS